MYANLRVTIAPRAARQLPSGAFADAEVLCAYAVSVIDDGSRLLIELDAADGEHEYPQHAGTHTVDLSTHHVLIEPDF